LKSHGSEREQRHLRTTASHRCGHDSFERLGLAASTSAGAPSQRMTDQMHDDAQAVRLLSVRRCDTRQSFSEDGGRAPWIAAPPTADPHA
jgi:hypothetical protein